MAKINLPSELLLLTIKDGHIYKDELSREKNTSRVKRKYKLAGKWPEQLKSQNVRIFFVSTSKSYSVKNRTSVIIRRSDYAVCASNVLLSCDSYYDLTRGETLSADQVKSKMDDPLNGFDDIATITDSAFKKFAEKTKNLHLQERPPKTVSDLTDIVKSVVDEDLSDNYLRDLHLI